MINVNNKIKQLKVELIVMIDIKANGTIIIIITSNNEYQQF